MAAAYPLASHPPYFLSWLNPQISVQNMMHPEMLEKLVLNNFCKHRIILYMLSEHRNKIFIVDLDSVYKYKTYTCIITFSIFTQAI